MECGATRKLNHRGRSGFCGFHAIGGWPVSGRSLFWITTKIDQVSVEVLNEPPTGFRRSAKGIKKGVKKRDFPISFGKPRFVIFGKRAGTL